MTRRRTPRRLRRPRPLPRLSDQEILGWADEHFRRKGQWPHKTSGRILGTLYEKWENVDMALRLGLRGLRAGSSLARLLDKHRGVRNLSALPSLTIRQILAWAGAHYRRTGKWPTRSSGPIPTPAKDTWRIVDTALVKGYRSLPGGSSLARLLEEERGVRNLAHVPPFSLKQILAWADDHYARTGTWPKAKSGPVLSAPDETWRAIQRRLSYGGRGLPGGSSLAQLLAAERGKRNHKRLPVLTVAQILAWADQHQCRTGKWPKDNSGPIPDAPNPDETWMAVERALYNGNRGLPGGSSLARLLAEQRGARNHLGLPHLTPEQILAWADAYHERMGRWPNRTSGAIEEAPGESWRAVDTALCKGCRGLPGGSSLPQLLAQRRQSSS